MDAKSSGGETKASLKEMNGSATSPTKQDAMSQKPGVAASSAKPGTVASSQASIRGNRRTSLPNGLDDQVTLAKQRVADQKLLVAKLKADGKKKDHPELKEANQLLKRFNLELANVEAVVQEFLDKIEAEKANERLDEFGLPMLEEEDESKEPAPDPVLGKLFLMPRNARRILEIEVELGCDKARIRPIGPDLGTSEGKFVHAVRARLSPNFYCVPYGMNQVLEVDPITSNAMFIGEPLPDAEYKYTSCVACNNWHGKLYAAPCRAERILEVDPDNGTMKEVGPPLGDPKVAKWYAIASVPIERGRIYAIPFDARRVLEIDPSRGGRAQEVGPDLGPIKGKYKAVCVAPTGDLYCPPLNATHVLKITAAGEVKLIGPHLGETQRKYGCCLIAPNKMIYAPPLYATQVLEITSAMGDVRLIGPEFDAHEAKYACAAVASNNKIYCAPLQARRVLEIYPEDHEAREIGSDLGYGEEKYSAIAAAPVGGKLYAAPREARNILEIDPTFEKVKVIGEDMGSNLRKYTCIVTGLTPLEIREAGKATVAKKTLALRRVERLLRDADFDVHKANISIEEVEIKVGRQKRAVEDVKDIAEKAAEEERIADKTKTKSGAEARAYLAAKGHAIECQNKVKQAEARLQEVVADKTARLRRLDECLEAQERVKKDVEEKTRELEVAMEEADKARLKEIEARRRKEEDDQAHRARQREAFGSAG